MAEVVRHGERWGVVETPGDPPVSEHPTREAALLAAGADAIVREDDPTGLDGVQDDGAGEFTGEKADDGGDATLGDEGARDRQAGL